MEVQQYYSKRSISTSEALLKITKATMPFSVEDNFQSIYTQAHDIANSCPVEMGGGSDSNLLYWMAEYCKAKNIIETGIAFDWSSLSLLLSISNRKNSLLISNDIPYENRNNDKYVGCVVPEKLKQSWKIINLPDRQAIPKALKRFQNSIDLCHYDSDKSYEGRMFAYPQLWAALRSGGCFISDDICDNFAFRDFCVQINVEPLIVSFQEKYLGIIIKP